MNRTRLSPALAVLLAVSACDVNLDRELSDLLQDPWGTKPFPVVIGGDDAHVYYATNLGDITITYPRPINELVLPGYLGPSNVYHFADKKRELIRPLAPSSAYFGQLVTDGRFLAYWMSLDEDLQTYDGVVVEDLWLSGPAAPRIVFTRESRELGWDMVLDTGRLAFSVYDPANDTSQIRVEDLFGADPTREFDAGQTVTSLALRGNLLAYGESTDGQDRVILRDLATDAVTVLAEAARLTNYCDPQVFLTSNSVIWAESTSSWDLTRVMLCDIPTGIRRVWSDDVRGFLGGATDDFLLTQEYVLPENCEGDDCAQKPIKVIVRRYDGDGKVRVLAEFRVDGLAGQAQTIGDRAVWVNADREVVIAPLRGGDRTSFKPF